MCMTSRMSHVVPALAPNVEHTTAHVSSTRACVHTSVMRVNDVISTCAPVRMTRVALTWIAWFIEGAF